MGQYPRSPPRFEVRIVTLRKTLVTVVVIVLVIPQLCIRPESCRVS